MTVSVLVPAFWKVKSHTVIPLSIFASIYVSSTFSNSPDLKNSVCYIHNNKSNGRVRSLEAYFALLLNIKERNCRILDDWYSSCSCGFEHGFAFFRLNKSDFLV